MARSVWLCFLGVNGHDAVESFQIRSRAAIMDQKLGGMVGASVSTGLWVSVRCHWCSSGFIAAKVAIGKEV